MELSSEDILARISLLFKSLSLPKPLFTFILGPCSLLVLPTTYLLHPIPFITDEFVTRNSQLVTFFFFHHSIIPISYVIRLKPLPSNILYPLSFYLYPFAFNLSPSTFSEATLQPLTSTLQHSLSFILDPLTFCNCPHTFNL